jgi:hypothetical protein
VVDRGEPVASCSEWHEDGTAGEDNRSSGLAVTTPAQAMGEARPGRHEPRWQESQGARGRSGIRLVSVDRKVACAVHPASEPRHPLVVAIQVAWVQGQHRSGIA